MTVSDTSPDDILLPLRTRGTVWVSEAGETVPYVKKRWDSSTPNTLKECTVTRADLSSPAIVKNLVYLSKEKYELNHLKYPSNWYINHINRKITNIGVAIMPAKSSQKRPGNNNFNITFVDMKLSKENSLDFKEWFSRKAETVALDIASFMSNGHKISITWSNDNSCWIVSATCKDEKNVNVDCCMSSRSDDWYEALAMCCFKNDIIAKGGRWLDESTDNNWG